MPENDFSSAQFAERRLTRSQKVVEIALTCATLIILYVLFIFSLIIQSVPLFVGYLIAISILGVLYQRTSRLKARMQGIFRDNRKIAIGLIVLLLLSYPILLRGNPYLVQIGALAAIYAVMALGLNITLGFAGLLDLGFAVYFGAGAYTSAQLVIHFGVNFWIGLIAGGFAAACFGFFVAWPALRVHDHYLALVTLAYGLVMDLLARNLHFITNGTDGVINIPPPMIAGHSFTDPLRLWTISLPFQANFYYLAIAVALMTAVISYRLRESKLGRAWEAIREDEVAARCSGISATRVKVLAFSIGACFGGIGGALYAHMIGYISPDNFTFLESMTLMVMVVLGGSGNIAGVAIGAVLLIILPERFREFAHLRLLLFGIALVLLMIYRPGGIFPRARRRRPLSCEKAARAVRNFKKGLPRFWGTDEAP